MYLSPYVEEPLNSKVIKSFVPKLRSRKCFSCFEISVYMLYICIFHIGMLCPFHISGYLAMVHFMEIYAYVSTLYIYTRNNKKKIYTVNMFHFFKNLKYKEYNLMTAKKIT